jgi:hypothetical protein
MRTHSRRKTRETEPNLAPGVKKQAANILKENEKHLAVAIQKLSRLIFISKGHSLKKAPAKYADFNRQFFKKTIPIYRKLDNVAKSKAHNASFAKELIGKTDKVFKSQVFAFVSPQKSPALFQLLEKNPASSRALDFEGSKQVFAMIASPTSEFSKENEELTDLLFQLHNVLKSCFSEKKANESKEVKALSVLIEEIKGFQLLIKSLENVGISKEKVLLDRKETFFLEQHKLLKRILEDVFKRAVLNVNDYLTVEGDDADKKGEDKALQLQKDILFAIKLFGLGTEAFREYLKIKEIIKTGKGALESVTVKYFAKSGLDCSQSYISNVAATAISKRVLEWVSDQEKNSVAPLENPVFTSFIEHLVSGGLSSLRESSGVNRQLV